MASSNGDCGRKLFTVSISPLQGFVANVAIDSAPYRDGEPVQNIGYDRRIWMEGTDPVPLFAMCLDGYDADKLSFSASLVSLLATVGALRQGDGVMSYTVERWEASGWKESLDNGAVVIASPEPPRRACASRKSLRPVLSPETVHGVERFGSPYLSVDLSSLPEEIVVPLYAAHTVSDAARFCLPALYRRRVHEMPSTMGIAWSLLKALTGDEPLASRFVPEALRDDPTLFAHLPCGASTAGKTASPVPGRVLLSFDGGDYRRWQGADAARCSLLRRFVERNPEARCRAAEKEAARGGAHLAFHERACEKRGTVSLPSFAEVEETLSPFRVLWRKTIEETGIDENALSAFAASRLARDDTSRRNVGKAMSTAPGHECAVAVAAMDAMREGDVGGISSMIEALREGVPAEDIVA